MVDIQQKMLAGEKVEVVVASASEAAKLAIPGDPGVYIVGTGNTGAAGAFLTLGVVYFIVISRILVSFVAKRNQSTYYRIRETKP